MKCVQNISLKIIRFIDFMVIKKNYNITSIATYCRSIANYSFIDVKKNFCTLIHCNVRSTK